MVDLRTLLERARTSEDGEAYAVVVRGPGFRIGMVARKRSRKVPIVFLEVVLDPFPERPDVDPRRMRGQGELVAALKSKGMESTATRMARSPSSAACPRTTFPQNSER